MRTETKATETFAVPMSDRRTHPWYRRYPVALFLGALGLSLVIAPFEEGYRGGDLLESAGWTAVLLTGLWALGGRRWSAGLGLALVTPALVGKWVNHWRPELVPDWLFLVPAMLFCLFLAQHLLRFILRASRVDSEVLCAGVAGYLLLGLLWAIACTLVARLVPNAFVFTAGPAGSRFLKGFTSIYYSFMTLTTVGYGDIIPVSGAARMLAMTEAVTGTLYMAVMVARLVSLYYSPGHSVAAPLAEQ